MNRPIKFRAWDEELKSWTVPFTLEDIASGEFIQASEFARMPKVQFTGLLDKNGKEIYEGDILSGKSSTGREKRFHVVWGRIGWETYEDNEYNLLWDGWEVIGNIYENENLLK